MLITDACSPAPRLEWDELVASDPDVVLTQTPIWTAALASARGFHDASVLYRLEDGRRFVLPMVRRWSAPAPRAGFPPAWGIGGPVGVGLDPAVVTAILADLARDRSLYQHVRPNPLQGPIWDQADTSIARKIDRRAHAIDLTGGAEATRGRIRKSGRRSLRTAEKHQVEVDLHLGGEMLEVYYERLYLASVERWASRQHEPVALARLRASRRDPLSKLQALARTLGPAFRLYLASVDGEPAAGNIVLWGPTNAHSTRGAIDYPLAHKSKAAYAADWAAISDACEAGFAWYHLGETGENPTLAEYKERIGATSLAYAEYRIERLPVHAVDTAIRSGVKTVFRVKDY